MFEETGKEQEVGGKVFLFCVVLIRLCIRGDRERAERASDNFSAVFTSGFSQLGFGLCASDSE